MKFQVEDININTCGRHVACRIIALLDFDMTLKQYIKFMNETTKKLNVDYDFLVSLIIRH